MTEHGKVKRRRFHPGYVLAASVIAIVVFFGSLALFPEWSQSAALILALAVGIIFSAVTFLADFRTAFASEAAPPATPPSIVTSHTTISGDHVGGDKVGGDKVDGNKITAGRDVVINQVTTPPVNALHQLPPPPADFTGRAADLDAILNDIAHGALISGVRGMGGIGKTALALVIADRLKAQYPDAQFFIPLRGASEKPMSSVEALTYALRRIHPIEKLPEDEAGLRAQYLSDLHDKRAIVLLDDAKDATQVLPLLPPASCILLITTRNTFAVPGLHARRLETLSPKDARALLITIAPRLEGVILSREAAKNLWPGSVEIPRFARNDTLAAIGLIAELCGYLPLALTVAGSALAEHIDLPVPDYIKRLNANRLKQLGAVDAALQASYDLLSSDLQALWRQLAVFPADFHRLAATHVWFEDVADESQDKAQDVLSELVKYSLTQYDEAKTRYSLHDLARIFGDAKLTDDERTTSQQRHATHYGLMLHAMEKLYEKGNKNIVQSLAAFDLEWLNIQAGQAWSAINTMENEAAAQLCYLYPDWPFLLELRLHPRDRICWIEEALAAARRLKNREYEAVHLSNLGGVYTVLGEMRKAIEFYEQALIIAREIGNRRGEGSILGNLGVAYKGLGEARRSIEFFEQVLVIMREIGDRRGEGNCLGNLGNSYSALGETRRAAEYYKEALAIARETGDKRNEETWLGNLGIIFEKLNETRHGIAFYERGLNIAREISDRSGEARHLWNMALAINKLGERAQAIVHGESALKIFEAIEDPHAEMVRQQLVEWKRVTR